MQRFPAEAFMTIGVLLQCLKEEMGLPPVGDAAFNFAARDTVNLSEGKARKVFDALQFIENECLRVSLHNSASIVSQTRGDFAAARELPKMYAIGRIASLEGAIRAEMQRNVFLSIPPERSERYFLPLKDWEQVVSRFPEVIPDIQESSHCFACDRYAASIFHCSW
jgi:hypothetical protein